LRFPGALAPDARSAVEYRPADAVPQLLVVKHELANHPRQLVALPLALEPACGFGLGLRRSGPRGLDRIGGRTELVRGDVSDDCGLASCIGGIPWRPTQVSGRAHGMAARCASLGHRDLATYPGAGTLDRLTRPWILRPGRLEQVKDVLRARCRPESKEMVIGISEGPALADRHQARVLDLREDHDWPFFGIKSALRDEGNRVPGNRCGQAHDARGVGTGDRVLALAAVLAVEAEGLEPVALVFPAGFDQAGGL
jgi:hypothetical protein